MKKTLVITITAVMIAVFLAACGSSNAGTDSAATSDTADTSVTTVDADNTSSDTEEYEDLDGNISFTEADAMNSKNNDAGTAVSAADAGDISTAVAKPEYVQVKGVVYQNTGYLSSAVGCGNMDGEITSTVDSSELPSEDNQSNFGTGYGYQVGGEDTILVDIQDEKWIFRDINLKDDSIPVQVARFIGTVEEIGENTILIRYDETPEDALNMALNEGEYVASSSAVAGDLQVGDKVEVWYSGYVMETYPGQIEAYRIEKVSEETVAEK